MSNSIYLETDRLIIRDHIMDDIETHHNLLTDPVAMYYLPEIKADSYEESALNLLEAIDEVSKSDRTKYFLRIEDKASKDHIGEIGYTVTSSSPAGKSVNLGYFIYPKYWNKGFTTEAVIEILRFAFEENDVITITTGCIKENIGSERVMVKSRFIKDPDYNQSQWHDGKNKQRVAYRLSKTEWELSRKEHAQA